MTAIVWFRRDLRVHDHPALKAALDHHDTVIPVFVFETRLLQGRFPSANRTAYLLDALRGLDEQLRERGSKLVIREGDPVQEIPKLVQETGAEVVHHTGETTGFARARNKRVQEALGDTCTMQEHPGLYIGHLNDLRTGAGKPYTVFTPFYRKWAEQKRRTVVNAPSSLPGLPSKLKIGRIPKLEDLNVGSANELVDRPPADEQGAKDWATAWIKRQLDDYDDTRDILAERTSRVSAPLRFGVLSARWLEDRVLAHDSEGATSYRSELCWRDFYAYVLLHYPGNATLEFREQYRKLEWDHDDDLLDAWREGMTGYPVIDAAMRQLKAMGWMHNRARMIVGSFLTKDLHLDWRSGEKHFMEHLLDGDEGSNNGGWQWIASTGTDPAPYFQRLFNPMTQQQKFDPDGRYVRRWCPELSNVPDKKLAKPWELSADEQQRADCVIGDDYPAPIVDHAQERQRAIERYRAVS